MNAPRDPYPELADQAPTVVEEPRSAYEEHLAYEREQDRLAGAEIEPDQADLAPAPPSRQVPILTALLLGLLVAFVFLLAGIELQKLVGGDPAPPAPAPAPAQDGAGEGGLTAGRIVAIRGRTIYLREPDGRTVKLRTAPDSRLAVGRPVGPTGIRPGQDVVIEAAPGAEPVARSVTVVPPRERP